MSISSLICFEDGLYQTLEAYFDKLQAVGPSIALGKLTRFVRDAMSRTSYETNANSEVLGFTYDPADNLATLKDGKQQTTRWNYDGEGRVTNKVDAASAEMFRYQYDPAGRLTNRWQAGGISTTFRYDPVGNLTNIVYPASSNVVLRYDALNRLTNLVDGIGTTAFAWTDGNQLASEDGPWASDTVNFGYTSRQRGSLSVQQPNASAWAQSYGYDAYWRLSSVTSSAGVFGTSYKDVWAGSAEMAADLVAQLNLPGGSYITNSQDDLGRLLSMVLENSTNGVLNSHTYVYNSGHQRTQQTFTAGNYTDYTYDDIGQLKTAKGKEADATSRLHEQFGYGYDAAWNLNYRTNNDLWQTFNVNNLNELSTITRGQKITVAGVASERKSLYSGDYGITNVVVSGTGLSSGNADVYADGSWARTNATLSDGNNTYTATAKDYTGRTAQDSITVNLPATATCYYDARGNLTNDGRRVFFYDDENQLINVLVSNAWKSEFAYDGFLRRRVRKEYTWQSSAWVKTNEIRYLYDGRLVVQERDANNLASVSYTRGTDLSGTQEGAGGIGGLLARTDNGQSIAGNASAHAYYQADGNGNITALVNTNQLVVAKYAYDPYGNMLASIGPLAEANLYRFSSKEWHPNSGLVYYLYRYYDPSLQRWVNRDPLEEDGGINLYAFLKCNPIQMFDAFGLIDLEIQLTEAIASGNAELIDTILTAGEGVLSDAQIATGRAALQKIAQEAAKKAALQELRKQLMKRCTDKVGKLAQQLGKKESDINKAIHKIKKSLPRGGGKGIPKNPDVTVDPVTGDVFPKTSDGSIGDCIGNIFDALGL